MAIAIRRVHLVAVMMAVGAFVGPTAAAAQNSIVGRWTLDLTKSSYPKGRAPETQSLVYAKSGDMMKVTSETIDAKGRPLHTEFLVAYDGKSYPIRGMPNADSATYKQTSANTTEFMRTLKGRVSSTGTRELSTNGRTLTITTTNIAADGTKTKSVAVFRR